MPEKQEQGDTADKGDVCPFCFESDISIVTDCYDDTGKKICELWDCRQCGGFFPRLVVIPGPPSDKKLAGKDAKSGRSRWRILDDDGPEKRRTPRFPVQFVVQVDFSEGGANGLGSRRVESLSEPIVAMVMNAGGGGLCFRYPEFVAEGRAGRMKISLPSVQKSFSALGRVVRSTRLPDGSYGLGVQFIEVEEEYRRALDRYVHLD